jgi:hypothetical protein
MPVFRAANQVDLLFPSREDHVHHIRKLEKLPGDYDELPYLHQRTDLIKVTGRLEVQDRVVLVVDRAGWQDVYEICCLRG